MADRMPEALRKHFEEKSSKEERRETHHGASEEQQEKRKEALHKAKKAKMKRKMEKQDWSFNFYLL